MENRDSGSDVYYICRRKRDVSFNPTKRPTGRLLRNIKLEVTPERYSEIQAIAASRGISIKELIRQSVDYALNDMA